MWNAVAGGTMVGTPTPTPIHELPRDCEQEELYEFGRWTRTAIPIGAGHRTFHVTSFYGPPKGDLIRNNYADKLLRLLLNAPETLVLNCLLPFAVILIETLMSVPT